MSRSAAQTAAGRTRTVRRSAAPPLPRRVSGPAAAPRGDDGRRYRSPRSPRLAYGGVAIASRVAGVALDVSASRLMDRVVRGRVWIGVIAFSLFGLVAMQVSLLKLNAGISRAAQTVSTLERSNAALRSDITSRSAGDRIQSLAAREGLVMPAPADIRYLKAGDRHGDALRAALRMRPPDPSKLGFAAAPTAPELAAGAPAGSGSGVTAPATTPPATTAPAAGAPAPAAPGPAPAGGGAPAAPATAAAPPPVPAAAAPAEAQPAAPAPAPATASGGAGAHQATAPAG